MKHPALSVDDKAQAMAAAAHDSKIDSSHDNHLLAVCETFLALTPRYVRVGSC